MRDVMCVCVGNRGVFGKEGGRSTSDPGTRGKVLHFCLPKLCMRSQLREPPKSRWGHSTRECRLICKSGSSKQRDTNKFNPVCGHRELPGRVDNGAPECKIKHLWRTSKFECFFNIGRARSFFLRREKRSRQQCPTRTTATSKNPSPYPSGRVGSVYKTWRR